MSIYSPKVGYKSLCEDRGLDTLEWWWKYVWKFKFALKTQIFKWMALKTKVLTWDVGLKRN
jgi:hypothetical protein